MNYKIMCLIAGFLLFSLISIKSDVIFGAWNTITNMTPATTSGGYLGNITHNYTFVGKINCSYIIGGTDANFCADADTGASGSFNQTYHDYVYGNYSNATLWWAGYTSPPASWTDTYNISYHGLWSSNRTSTSNSSSFWDNLDSPLTSWTDTYNLSYHDFWAANISAKTDYVNNITERNLFTSVYNSSYLTSEALWQGNSTLVDFKNTANQSNSTIWWNGYTSTPTIWTTTENSTYTAYLTYNYSAKTDYVNNATERALFLSTYNASYLTSYTESDPKWQGNYSLVAFKDTANQSNSSIWWSGYTTPPASWTSTENTSYLQLGGDLGGTVTAPTVLRTQGLTWGNITSGWDLNKAWANTLGWNNISARSLNIAWTGSLGWGNLTGFNLNSLWTGTLGGGNITSGTITTTQLTAGTMNQGNITNTVSVCSNQFSRGMGAATQNCASVSNGDMSSGDYDAITGIGTQAQNLNMNNYNVTGVQCITFQSGGRICSA